MTTDEALERAAQLAEGPSREVGAAKCGHEHCVDIERSAAEIRAMKSPGAPGARRPLEARLREALKGTPGEGVPYLDDAVAVLAKAWRDATAAPAGDTPVTVREACRRRMPLDGTDALHLELALQITERDAARAEAIAQRDCARALEFELECPGTMVGVDLCGKCRACITRERDHLVTVLANERAARHDEQAKRIEANLQRDHWEVEAETLRARCETSYREGYEAGLQRAAQKVESRIRTAMALSQSPAMKTRPDYLAGLEGALTFIRAAQADPAPTMVDSLPAAVKTTLASNPLDTSTPDYWELAETAFAAVREMLSQKQRADEALTRLELAGQDLDEHRSEIDSLAARLEQTRGRAEEAEVQLRTWTDWSKLTATKADVVCIEGVRFQRVRT